MENNVTERHSPPNEILPRIISQEDAEGEGIPWNATWPTDLEDTLCGVGSCRPRWLQRLADGRVYTAVFCLIGIVQGMMFTYYIAVITTIEKRFKLPSKVSGFVMVGNDIATVASALFFSYYGGQGHRPHWVCLGVLLSAISCFLLSSPHFLYGPGDEALRLAVDATENGIDAQNAVNGTSHNETNANSFLCSTNEGADRSRAANVADCYYAEQPFGPMAIMFASHLLGGMGMTLYYTVGTTYMDDGVKKTESPIMFGITTGVRYIGPALGFLLASACLDMYVDPLLVPTITPDDPRWIGAWWIGFIFIATLLLFTILFMYPFPRKLRKRAPDAAEEREQLNTTKIKTPQFLTDSEANTNKQRTIADFPSSLRKLLENKVLMFNNAASTFYMFGAVGYFSFLPKYMEAQFRTTAATASLISGSTQIIFIAIGLMVSGCVISRCRPCAKFLAGWNVFLGFIYVIAQLTFILVGCQGPPIHGVVMDDGTMDTTTTCNNNCACQGAKFSPVCSQDGQMTFYSPCHAGCNGLNETGDTVFTNCSCILRQLDVSWPIAEGHESGAPEGLSYEFSTATDGWCHIDCGDRFLIFIIVMAVVKMVNSTGKVGNILVALRCVDERDKSFSLGLTAVMLSVGAFIPSPIVYGAVIDSTCLIWDNKCGERGNCWIYDSEGIRVYLHLTTAIAMSLSTFFDAMVWLHVGNLKLYGEVGDGTKDDLQMDTIVVQ